MDIPQIPEYLRAAGVTRVLAFDYETYYNTADGYSLSTKGMTTEIYVRDPRFETICVTATLDGVNVYRAWGEQECAELLRTLGAERKDTLSIAHNARFDGTVVEYTTTVRFAWLCCTMHLMRITGLSRFINESLSVLSEFLRGRGYPVPPKGHEVNDANGLHLADMTAAFRESYIRYCSHDTIILYCAALVMLQEVQWDNIRASDMTLKMYTRPVIELDLPLLEKYLEDLHKRREETLTQMAHEYDCATIDDFIRLLRSKRKFAELLRREGIDPPMKESEKKTKARREQMADPELRKKKQTPKFLKQLADEGKTFDEWAAEPVMEYAFSKKDLDFMELCDHPNPRVRALMDARLENNSSIAESRTVRFIEAAKRGAFVIALQLARAHTHRYGADDGFNTQNLPKRKGDKTLRYSMRAPVVDGVQYEVGGADSSQIEARCLAYAAQETTLLSIFESGGDPYSYMAEIIYRESQDAIKLWAKKGYDELVTAQDTELHKKYKNMRDIGKTTVLGSGYQMSGKKFGVTLQTDGIALRPTKDECMKWLQVQPLDVRQDQQALRVAFDTFLIDYHTQEATRINRAYRNAHTKIVGFWKQCEWVLSKMCQGEQGYFGGEDGELFYFDGKHEVFGMPAPGIQLPNGEWLVYPGLKSFREDDTGYIKYKFKFKEGHGMIDKFIYGGSLTENLMQALAFTILVWQAVRIHAVLPVKGNVHDEWFSVYPAHLREQAKAVYTRAMSAVPPFVPNMPLACEFSAGPTYGDM